MPDTGWLHETRVPDSWAFEVTTEARLRELRRLAMAPISIRPGQDQLYDVADREDLPVMVLASYRWSTSELVRHSRQLHELLGAYVDEAPAVSADLLSGIEGARDIHSATTALGQVMAESIAAMATVFEGVQTAPPGPQRRFCTEIGPLLTAEWILMTGFMGRLSSGCSGLINHLSFLAFRAADIEVTPDGFTSPVAAVERGLAMGRRRMARLLREQDSLLAEIEGIDQARLRA